MTSIASLSHDEQLALVALIKAIALANQDITEGEMSIIDKVAKELGDETYRGLLNESVECYGDIEDVKTALAAIDKKESVISIVNVFDLDDACAKLAQHRAVVSLYAYTSVMAVHDNRRSSAIE